MVIKLTVHRDEEERDIDGLRKKLKEHGFKLNDKFDKYVIPEQGTFITRSIEKDQIIYFQTFTKE